MEKLKQYKYIILIIVLILGFAFYWYEIRISNIRKDCVTESIKLAGDVVTMETSLESTGLPITQKADYEKLRDERFKNCILEHGLKNYY